MCTLSLDCPISEPLYWNIDETGNWGGIINESYIDSEFAIFFDELFGTIERIYEPGEGIVLTLVVECILGFLGDNWNVRVEGLKIGTNVVIGSFIGDSKRGIILLIFN